MPARILLTAQSQQLPIRLTWFLARWKRTIFCWLTYPWTRKKNFLEHLEHLALQMHLPPSVVLEREHMRLLLSSKSIYASLILILLDYDVDDSSGTSNQVRGERERGRRKNSRVGIMDLQQGWPTLPPPKGRSHRLITTLLPMPSNLKYNLRLKANISWRMKAHSASNPAVTFPPGTQTLQQSKVTPHGSSHTAYPCPGPCRNH